MLLESSNEEGEPKTFHLAKNLYKSCMEKEAIENIGLDPIKQILKKLGGWPVLEGDSWKNFSANGQPYIWYEQVYKLRTMGYSNDFLVDFSVTTDLKNSSWRVLDLDQPEFGLSREYLIKGLDDEDVKV